VHEPRAVHRLHHPTHRLAIHRQPPRQPVQPVAIRRRAEMLDQLSLAGDQAHIHALAAEIQPDMQHLRSTPFHEHEQDQPAPRRTVSKVGPSFRIAGRAGYNRARVTYVVRRGGPTAFTRRLPASSGPALVHHSQREVAVTAAPRRAEAGTTTHLAPHMDAARVSRRHQPSGPLTLACRPEQRRSH
jgi:hypothetical protein